MNLTTIDYRARLARVTSELGRGALLAMSQPPAYRNATVDHAWRQESFLHWLTGFEEPESALLVLPFKPEGERYVLFLRERDAEREIWDGRRLGVERAKERLAVDAAYPIQSLWEKLPDLLGDADKVYFNLGLHEDYDRRFIAALTNHKNRHGKRNLAAKLPVHDASHLAGKLRLRKSADEIERMRAAATVTGKAFAKVYQSVRPGMTEREVHGILIGAFMANGGEMEAYGGIVAGGANACILHYRENDQILKDGELLLIDAATQFQYYASDVTRTFPIGKTYTSEQRALYDVVLAAQKAAIAKATIGSTLTAVHDEAVSKLVDGMIDLELLKASKDEIVTKALFRKYFPHGTSHWIGMDVHDVGVYSDGGKPLPLEAGMYFSVEPGLYVDPADESAPKGFRGVGIRIEDDVLVTSRGPEPLTAGIAKEARELENRY